MINKQEYKLTKKAIKELIIENIMHENGIKRCDCNDCISSIKHLETAIEEGIHIGLEKAILILQNVRNKVGKNGYKTSYHKTLKLIEEELKSALSDSDKK